MSKKTIYSCKDCGNPVSKKETVYCMTCVGKHKPLRVDPIEAAQRRKIYKANYFQKNKTKIMAKRKQYELQNKDKIKERHIKYHLRHTKGIELEEYQNLLEKQNKQCKICEYVMEDNSIRHKKLYVDHDHKTGRVRGLLCQRCNSALGLFKDDINLLNSAIQYLNNK